MKAYRVLFFLIFCNVVAFQANAVVDLNDFVSNRSFENPVLSMAGEWEWGLPGWETEGEPRIEWPAIPVIPTDGVQYLESYGSTCRLPLYELPIEPNTTYTFSADIAVHSAVYDNPAPELAWLIMYMDNALSPAGTFDPLAVYGGVTPETVYGTIPGHIGDANYPVVATGPGPWYTVSCSFDSNSIDSSLIGKPLRLNFRGDYLKIDNLHLSASGTPVALTVNATSGAEDALLSPSVGSYEVGNGWTIPLDAMAKYVDCPNDLYTFSQWSGADSPSNNITEVTINGATTVTATYNKTSPGCTDVNIPPSVVEIVNGSFETPIECVDDVDGDGYGDCDIRQDPPIVDLNPWPDFGWGVPGGSEGSGVGTVSNPKLAGLEPTDGVQAGALYRDYELDTFTPDIGVMFYYDFFGDFTTGEILEFSFDLAPGQRSDPNVSTFSTVWLHGWYETGGNMSALGTIVGDFNSTGTNLTLHDTDDPNWVHYTGEYTVVNPLYPFPGFEISGYRFDFRLYNLRYWDPCEGSEDPNDPNNWRDDVNPGDYAHILVDNVQVRKVGAIQSIPATVTILADPNVVLLQPVNGTFEFPIGTTMSLLAPTTYLACPDIYNFNQWQGESRFTDPNEVAQELFIDDDKNITALFTQPARVCGDQCHPYPQGDLNQNCIVDFYDFADFANAWMFGK